MTLLLTHRHLHPALDVFIIFFVTNHLKIREFDEPLPNLSPTKRGAFSLTVILFYKSLFINISTVYKKAILYIKKINGNN
ncbi:hypothetical protein NIES4103_21680 [Nostoc sp. NIES-4103]|nr:hypothetical protein NIES4103_21680 [Nostoc sp. NIES-4103]